MPERAIQDFFQQRKNDWLNKKVKPSMTESEIKQLKNECNEKFSPNHWLPDAAKRASQITITTHPCTFSHPSARKNKNGYVSSVITKVDREADGYLKTGNITSKEDALGNAAALDVYKFLTLILDDGYRLLDHIERDTEQAKALLNISSESYQNLKNGFLAMVNNQASEIITSSKIKQVYFPVEENEYHLLSMLSNSGIIYELRQRIDNMRFSEKQKERRDLKRNNKYSSESFSEIYEIVTIGYGGTKPQNISVLNNQNGGKARLLVSSPPKLRKRSTQFPKQDFFSSSIRFYDIQEPLNRLHNIFKTGLDTAIPRRHLEAGRDHRVEEILDQIIHRMAAIRSISVEQYREESNHLPLYQKIWLCHEHLEMREDQNQWLDELCSEISHWIITAYKKVIKQPVALGPAERSYILEIIETHREALR